MHTEHLQNVKPTAVFGGWLVAAAVTSLIVLILVGFELIPDPEVVVGPVSALTTLVVGFWVGGFFAGVRAVQAPVLHGIAIGLTSLLVWVLLNILAAVLPVPTDWSSITTGLALGAILTQIAAAVIGALMGYNVALRGRPGLAE
jgi:hypothetical protein